MGQLTSEQRKGRGYRERNYHLDRRAFIGIVEHVRVPENVERRPVSSSCFMCESRGPCRHREREFA